jgi:hypothetical protein
MARIIYGPHQAILHFDTNESVADIQSVAHRRFCAGQGFFMTMAGSAAEAGIHHKTVSRIIDAAEEHRRHLVAV